MAPSPPRGRETAPRPAEASFSGAKPGRAPVIAEQRPLILELLAAGKTVVEISTVTGVTCGVARHLKQSGGKKSRPGPSPFFMVAEEELMFQFLRMRALIGPGLTRDAFLKSCEEYILTLSAARQETAKLYFGGKTKLGKAFFELFMRR